MFKEQAPQLLKPGPPEGFDNGKPNEMNSMRRPTIGLERLPIRLKACSPSYRTLFWGKGVVTIEKEKLL